MQLGQPQPAFANKKKVQLDVSSDIWCLRCGVVNWGRISFTSCLAWRQT